MPSLPYYGAYNSVPYNKVKYNSTLTTGGAVTYTRTHSTDSLKRKANTISQSTDALKRKATTQTHTTDANKKVAGNTRLHTTDANKKKSGPVSTHSTDANKKKTTTVFHTTSANKRVTGATKIHTTDALKRISGLTKTHTTDSLKRISGAVKTHTTDANKRKQNTLTHSSDSNKKKTTTVSHTTSSNLKKTGLVASHTTDSLKRKQSVIFHTADANKRLATIRTHTADANKHVSGISRIVSGNGAAGSATLSGTYSIGDFILLELQNTGSATTPSTPTGYTNISSATDATNNHAMRVVYKYATSTSETMPTLTNTTSVSWAIYTGVASTSPVVQISGQAGTTSTISASGIVSYQNPADWVIITAVGKPISGNIGSHPFNSVSLVTEYKTGSDDNALFDSNGPLSAYSFNSKTLDGAVSWLTKTFELVVAVGGVNTLTTTHTTDSNKRKAVTASHTTDSNKRSAGLTRTHTTDANKRVTGSTKFHTTDSLKRAAVTKSHTTDSLKRKTNTLSHTTSSNKRQSYTVVHTTSANKRKSGITTSHSTDSFNRKQNTVAHSTDSNKKKSSSVSHTTSSNLRKTGVVVSHTTNSLIRKQSVALHTTDANKRLTITHAHTTDANKRKTGTKTHTTDSYLRDRRNYSRTTAGSLPTDASQLATVYSAAEITETTLDNSVYVAQNGTNYLLHEFAYQHINSSDAPTLTWNGDTDLDPTINTVYLQIWNVNSSTWETLSSNNTAAINTDFTLTGTQPSSVANYYDTNHIVTFRVYQGGA